MAENFNLDKLTQEDFNKIGIKKGEGDEILRPSLTYMQDAWRRLKKNKISLVALIVLILVILMTIIGPIISSYSFQAISDDVNQSPSIKHLFGTDQIGRDLFTRVWVGGRVSILIGLIGAFVDTVVGSIYGGISGFFGGLVDDIMMRIVEILVSIPYLILVILVSLIVGKGIGALILAMTLTGWCYMARLVRGQLLQIKEQEYVLAARALGASSARIIAKHLIPNTISIMIVAITFDIPGFIFGEAFLSYIGLGVQSPDTSWGALASAAQQQLMFYPYQLFFPALFISLTMLSFQLLGDGLRDALDPKLRV